MYINTITFLRDKIHFVIRYVRILQENVSTITELITPGDNDDEILLSDIATTSVKEKISLFQVCVHINPV